MGMADKLNSHIKPKAQHTVTQLSVDRNNPSHALERTRNSVAGTYSSVVNERERAELREELATRLRQDMFQAQIKTNKIKMVNSFFAAFGKGTKGAAHAKLDKGDEPHAAIRNHNVVVTGVSLAKPLHELTTFQQLKAFDAPDLLILALEGEHFIRPTPVQGNLWIASQLNYDIVCLGLPGSGKTIGYILPAILHVLHNRAGYVAEEEEEEVDPEATPAERRRQRKRIKDTKKTAAPLVVIVVPTTELAMQVFTVCQRLANPCGITSGLVSGEYGQIPHTAEIVVGTPDRLAELSTSMTTKGKKIKKKLVSFERTGLFIIDEADYLMQNQENVNLIDTLYLRKAGAVQTFMIASTWSAISAVHAKKYLSAESTMMLRVGGSEAGLPSVSHKVHIVPAVDRAAFIALMFSKNTILTDNVKVLIFAATPKDVMMLYDSLITVMHPRIVGMVHEEQLQYQRDIALGAFHSGETRVLITTDILSRGIHIERVGIVMNYDVPLEDTHAVLIQRNGRTGRVNSRGVAHTFVNHSLPKPVLRSLESMLHPSERSEALSDLTRDDTEKSAFMKKTEMHRLANPTSFDAI